MRRRPDPSADVEARADRPAECPYCGSTNTELEHPKGPSLCRSIHYCKECNEPFEAFG